MTLLMIPGPSMPEPRVLRSLSGSTLPHYGRIWKEIYEDTTRKLQTVFRTSNEVIILPAPGQAAVEMAVANLVRRGEEAFVCRNGYFSEVIVEMIHAYGGIPVPIRSQSRNSAVSPELARAVIEETPDHEGKALFVVHNETSTGVVNPAKELLAVCHDTGVVSVLDAISSFGGMDVRIDEWKADFCVGYASKGLGAVNGVVPVSIGDECWKIARRNKDTIPSRFLNLNVWRHYIDVWGPWGHAYPCSMPTELVVALNKAVDLVLEEGLEARFSRHRAAGEQMRKGFDRLDLKLFTDKRYLSDTLSVASVEPSWEGELRERLLSEHGIMIAGGLDKLSGKVIRVAHMGTSAKPRTVSRALAAMGSVLDEVRVK